MVLTGASMRGYLLNQVDIVTVVPGKCLPFVKLILPKSLLPTFGEGSEILFADGYCCVSVASSFNSVDQYLKF